MLCFSGDFSGSVYENMMYFQQLCFFSSVFLCVFFFFLSCRFKGMQGTVRSGLITVLKTVRSDRGSHGSLLLSSRIVLDAKRTAKMSGSRFFRSDRMVRSGFHNHALKFTSYTFKSTIKPKPIPKAFSRLQLMLFPFLLLHGALSLLYIPAHTESLFR